jgi:hypothetical protein
MARMTEEDLNALRAAAATLEQCRSNLYLTVC